MSNKRESSVTPLPGVREKQHKPEIICLKASKQEQKIFLTENNHSWIKLVLLDEFEKFWTYKPEKKYK